MQYFLTAAFCWMLVEGIYLYLFVVKVYNINTKMHMYHVISWGIFIIYFITTYIGSCNLLSYLLLSSSQVLWIYFFVCTIRSPYDHDGHFTWHCCCERRNSKLYQWWIVRNINRLLFTFLLSLAHYQVKFVLFFLFCFSLRFFTGRKNGFAPYLYSANVSKSGQKL